MSNIQDFVKCAPVKAFEVSLPVAWAGFLERPVITKDGVLVTGCNQDSRRKPGTDVILLTCLARQDGAELFRFCLPDEEGKEIYSSLPVVAQDGDILLSAYCQDRWLKTYRLDAAGKVKAQQEIGLEKGRDLRNDYNIIGGDLSSKLFMAPPHPCDEERLLVSWLYRQVRFFRTEYRSWSSADTDSAIADTDSAIAETGGAIADTDRAIAETGGAIADTGGAIADGPIWSCNEWLLGASNSIALCASYDRPTDRESPKEELSARRIDNGELLWRSDYAGRVFGCVKDDAFLLVDRSLRLAEYKQRELRYQEELEQNEDLEVMEYFEKNPLTSPSMLLAADADSGEFVQRFTVAGEIFALMTHLSYIAVVCGDESGRGHIMILDSNAAANPVATRSVATNEPGVPVLVPVGGTWPLLVYLDERCLIWSEKAQLICSPIDDLQSEHWRMTLPAGCAGFHPRMRERLLTPANIVVEDDLLVLRTATKLLGYRWCV